MTTPKLQLDQDTWLIDPVADSIYKDISLKEEDVSIHEGEVIKDVTNSQRANLSAAIQKALATTSVPQPQAEATTPDSSVDVANEPAKVVNAKIREYR